MTVIPNYSTSLKDVLLLLLDASTARWQTS